MINRKHLSQNIAFGLFRLLSLSVVGILFAILGFIIYKGVGVIDLGRYSAGYCRHFLPDGGQRVICLSGRGDEWHLYE